MTQYRGVALVGNKSVGKSSLSAVLEQEYLVRRVHPKTMFSEMVSPILLRMGVAVDELSERCFGAAIDQPLPAPFQHRTCRCLQQAAGGGFLKDFGVEGLAHMLTAPKGAVHGLIESVRRPEEAAWLRETFGYALIAVVRPSLGGPTHEHATECDLSGVCVDAEIVNDGTLDDLYARGCSAVSRLLDVRSAARHALLVINGRPQCGKDSLTEMLRARCNEHDIAFDFLSSIDPVRDMLEDAGVPVARKTDADRDLLAGMKTLLRKHQDWPNQWLHMACGRLHERARPGQRTLFVTHIREAEEIAGLARRAPVVAMWMHGRGAPTTTLQNKSDLCSADQYPYDATVSNSGTLEELERKSVDVLRGVFAHAKTRGG